ncbi:hypothetical protein [Lysinibacillus sp. FSL P2-0066]|uniref:hypothetical protein n=1 Tax=Lysinibacillus sp. FSL P2-0066 TaxID=2921720 RepID=UPI0030DD78DD
MKNYDWFTLDSLTINDFPVGTQLNALRTKHQNTKLIGVVTVLEYYPKFILIQHKNYRECYLYGSNDLIFSQI